MLASGYGLFMATTPPRLRDIARVRGKALKHLSTIFPNTCDRFTGQQADMLVTHEAPSCHTHSARCERFPS